MVLGLHTECVRQSREPRYPHPHGQVATLDVRRAHMVGIRMADEILPPGADADRRAIAARCLWRWPVKLDQSRRVHVDLGAPSNAS